jgi:hypothetical protein
MYRLLLRYYKQIAATGRDGPIPPEDGVSGPGIGPGSAETEPGSESLSSSAKDLGNQIPIHRGASSTRRSAGAERMNACTVLLSCHILEEGERGHS